MPRPRRRRFGDSALPIGRAAGWAVFNQLHVTKAATGTPGAGAAGHADPLRAASSPPRARLVLGLDARPAAAPNHRAPPRHRARQRREVARAMAATGSR